MVKKRSQVISQAILLDPQIGSTSFAITWNQILWAGVTTTSARQGMTLTAQKMKFSITDFLSKCDQIHSFLRIWSHLLKKSVMENFISFCSDYSDYLMSNHHRDNKILSAPAICLSVWQLSNEATTLSRKDHL